MGISETEWREGLMTFCSHRKERLFRERVTVAAKPIQWIRSRRSRKNIQIMNRRWRDSNL